MVLCVVVIYLSLGSCLAFTVILTFELFDYCWFEFWTLIWSHCHSSSLSSFHACLVCLDCLTGRYTSDFVLYFFNITGVIKGDLLSFSLLSVIFILLQWKMLILKQWGYRMCNSNRPMSALPPSCARYPLWCQSYILEIFLRRSCRPHGSVCEHRAPTCSSNLLFVKNSQSEDIWLICGWNGAKTVFFITADTMRGFTTIPYNIYYGCFIMAGFTKCGTISERPAMIKRDAA